MIMMIKPNDFHLYDTETMKMTATTTMPTTTPLPSPPMRDGDGEDGNIDIRENSYTIYTLYYRTQGRDCVSPFIDPYSLLF